MKVKTSGGNKTLIIGIVGLVVVIAVCAFFIIRRNKKKAKRKSLYTK
ncbi:MAG: LPXTG cell wall anchor domain-containing protein [Oscillospiraceae bacterium]|nr:LPXTG cell wall anchor domain-containing protein [Oscillospiraceae bacterium]